LGEVALLETRPAGGQTSGAHFMAQEIIASCPGDAGSQDPGFPV
jgi:hypothetical protein